MKNKHQDFEAFRANRIAKGTSVTKREEPRTLAFERDETASARMGGALFLSVDDRERGVTR